MKNTDQITPSRSRPVHFGTSPAMILIKRQIDRMADVPYAVLISGESGTGKGVYARYMHEKGKGQEKPFIAVNCAATPRDLLESEFFGHEKGAFSGAANQKKGRFELAHEGTLFLDEIGEIPLELQPKLLTFLQEKAFYRVGGNTRIAVDTRIIAATNSNLRQSIAEGKFREDLYYRLNVVAIELPPLRERRQDIPVFALYFIKKALGELGYEASFEVTFSEGALDAILHYSWPGNIRELENAMYRIASLMDQDGKITRDLLPPELSKFPAGSTEKPASHSTSANWVGHTLAEMERALVRDTLKHTGGNKQMTATLLGISEKSVYNKIKRYEL